jgi:hypothetical protein
MMMFLIALVAAILGVGAYAYYNPGVQGVSLGSYHFAGVPDWLPPAAAAGGVLFLFLLHSLRARRRIRRLGGVLGQMHAESRERILERWAGARTAEEDHGPAPGLRPGRRRLPPRANHG